MQVQMARLKEEDYHRRVAYRNLEEYEVDIGMSGTSCTLLIIVGDTVYYGFVGDSLVAISKFLNSSNDNKNISNMDYIITKPWHVPDNLQEKMRIYKNRGEVRGNSIKSVKKNTDPHAVVDVTQIQEAQKEDDFEIG